MEEKETRKLYTKPLVIHDLELETRAGSVPVVNSDDPFDL